MSLIFEGNQGPQSRYILRHDACGHKPEQQCSLTGSLKPQAEGSLRRFEKVIYILFEPKYKVETGMFG
jgi:hypothetical protein